MSSVKGPSELPDAVKAGQSDEQQDGGRDAAGFVAEVSHELRLPIANIKLLVETLLDGALEDEEVCRRMLKRAHQEVQRLQVLVTDLLSLEQVSQSSDQGQKRWIDLAARARYAADTVATMAMSKGVEVQVRVKSGFRVYANAEQFDQVLLNLVENAVKFTGAGGLVTVASGNEAGTFTVSDTGIGIPAAEIPKIFQRFYRVDRTQSKGSSGLGLSIVKNIAELHGARVHVESKEGEGSRFTLSFPGPSGK